MIFVVAIAPSLEPNKTRANGYREQQTFNKSAPVSTDDRIADYNYWLTILTAVLAGASIFQFWFLIRSDKTARIVADAARDAGIAAVESNEISRRAIDADQRPWIEPRNPRLVGTIMRIENRFYTAIDVTAVNCGRAPATNVRFDAEIYIPRIGHAMPPTQKLLAFAEKWRSTTDSNTGEVIFRDGELERTHSLIIDQTDVNDVLNSQTGPYRFVSVYVFGCISYKSAHLETARRTCFAYPMVRPNKDGAAGISPSDASYWQAQFALAAPGIILAD